MQHCGRASFGPAALEINRAADGKPTKIVRRTALPFAGAWPAVSDL